MENRTRLPAYEGNPVQKLFAAMRDCDAAQTIEYIRNDRLRELLYGLCMRAGIFFELSQYQQEQWLETLLGSAVLKREDRFAKAEHYRRDVESLRSSTQTKLANILHSTINHLFLGRLEKPPE